MLGHWWFNFRVLRLVRRVDRLHKEAKKLGEYFDNKNAYADRYMYYKITRRLARVREEIRLSEKILKNKYFINSSTTYEVGGFRFIIKWDRVQWFPRR